MLRRRLFALLLCLVTAALPVASVSAAVMPADHACMQHDGASGDCNSTTTQACTFHCAAAVYTVATVNDHRFIVASVRPLARETVLAPDCRAAPETAPPKASLS